MAPKTPLFSVESRPETGPLIRRERASGVGSSLFFCWGGRFVVDAVVVVVVVVAGVVAVAVHSCCSCCCWCCWLL